VKPETNDWDNWFSEGDKELQQIFQGQSEMKNVLGDLYRKMDEIIGRQERTLSVIAALQGNQLAGGGVPLGGGPQVGAGGIPVDTIRRDEVNAVLANQREIVTASRDIKNFVIDIHTKTGQLLARGTGSAQQVAGPASGGAAGYDVSASVQEMKESLNIIRRDLTATSQRIAQQPPVKCPEVAATGGPTSCVSTTLFVVLLVVQMIVLISYLIYRDSKEAQAKKFY
jgi:mannose-binding lectin 1